MNTKASEIVINDGVRTSICSTGGGVRAMLSMWAILKKFGRSPAQVLVIATRSGSSWFVNQLLFSKKLLDDDHAGTGKANAYTFEAAVDNIYSVNSDVENGQDVVSSRAAGHKMAGYNSISKYFSYKHNGEPNSDEAHGGFAGLIKFPLTDLRLVRGKLL